MITGKEFLVLKDKKPPKEFKSIYRGFINKNYMAIIYNHEDPKSVNGNMAFCELLLINLNNNYVIKNLLYPFHVDTSLRAQSAESKTPIIEQVLKGLKKEIKENKLTSKTTANERLETYKKITVDVKFNQFDSIKWQRQASNHFKSKRARN